MKVLVVDDSATQRLIVKSIAKNYAGVAEVFEATEGNKAFEIIKSENINIVFSDINMEPMSGIDLFKKVKDVSNGEQEIHFAFMTSHLTESMQNKAKELGVDDYITKPITQEKVEAVLEKVINA